MGNMGGLGKTYSYDDRLFNCVVICGMK
jgi:hypothetical protein